MNSFTTTGYSVAVIGCTGAVGQEMITSLHRRHFPVASLSLFASERSAGKNISTPYGEITITLFSVEAARTCDVVFLAVSGSFAKEHAKNIAAQPGGLVRVLLVTAEQIGSLKAASLAQTRETERLMQERGRSPYNTNDRGTGPFIVAASSGPDLPKDLRSASAICVLDNLDDGVGDNEVTTTGHTDITSAAHAGVHAIVDAVGHAQKNGITEASILVGGLGLEGHVAGTAKFAPKTKQEFKDAVATMKDLLAANPGLRVMHMSEQDRHYSVMRQAKGHAKRARRSKHEANAPAALAAGALVAPART
jgi:hypothetical protein